MNNFELIEALKQQLRDLCPANPTELIDEMEIPLYEIKLPTTH